LSALAAEVSRETAVSARAAVDLGGGTSSAAASTPSLGRVFVAAAAGAADATPVPVGKVTCPGCRTDYGLPRDLLPPWGGHVRCPRCAAEFSVGARAVADAVIAGVSGRDETAWSKSCADRSLWGDFGEELLEGYASLRERFGTEIAARAFRRSLEAAAPGVPWFAPPTPKNPLEHAMPERTLFERRQEVI
jgi:predicted Zn finger-like uncharacterized protein